MYQIELTNKFKNKFKKVASKDKLLFAEINEKIKLLEKGFEESLILKPIIRKKGKYKIQEIVIKNPSSYRVFYVIIKIKSNKILLIDGRRKKVQKFKADYYKILDKCIDEHLSKD